jgi:carbon-monoxide dehydrogenase small subunit
MRLTCTINGETRQADDLWEGESLLYALRERLGLPGSKNACEQGECGSCSVYLDGVLVCACLVLAGQAEGAEIVTVEGLAPADTLHPVQEAYVEAGAVQCGFCTPGLIVATHDLLRRNPSPTDPEIREALAGNLCRCTGYEKILSAVRLAADRGAWAEGRGGAGSVRGEAGGRQDSGADAADPRLGSLGRGIPGRWGRRRVGREPREGDRVGRRRGG